MKTICFAGLMSETNLGDIIIIESTKGLYKETLKGKGSFKFSDLNLQFTNLNFFYRAIRKLKRLFYSFFSSDSSHLEVGLLKKHYKKQIKNADLLVLVGGGLIKYKYQGFFLYLTALIEVAKELDIPLVINAVGVEGYDEDDPRCQLLEKSLNNDIVKSITTRDDIETLTHKYIYNNEIHTTKVADSAVYCDEIYKVSKKTSEVYGIGLVRGGIFLDNERNFNPEQVAQFYSDLILEIESRNLKYQLFTNGLPADKELLHKIEQKICGKKLNIIEPKKDTDLISAISKFKGVLAARLHANIISYALNVPSIGLVWNDKLTLFGEDIGYPERFFEYDKFNAKKIVDALVFAAEQGYEPQRWLEYKRTAKSNIEEIVEKWLAGEL
jgi:polysaccharide pyruvyl transferase WcaK-like protein